MTDMRARKLSNILLVVLACALVFCLVQLGNWQVRRLAQKEALIAAVDERAFNAPVEAPAQIDWPEISQETHSYQRVTITGHFPEQSPALVKAVTDYGMGYWVLAALERNTGTFVWINRGFIQAEDRANPEWQKLPEGDVTVTGLLRLSVPDGTLLESNNPSEDKWFSIDTDVLSKSRNLGATAPYYIAADATEGQEWPKGGLTKISFPNNHLQYALTWYAMALLLAGTTIALIYRARTKGLHDPDED